MEAAPPSEEEEPEASVSPILGGGEIAEEFDYATCKHMTSSGSMVECIYVAVVDGKHLMAFPAAAWHRKVAKRLLQSDALRKATSVELACCGLEDRSQVDGSVTMKVWMGYVGDEFISGLEYGEDESEMEIVFGVEEVRSHLPFLGALGEAAREQKVAGLWLLCKPPKKMVLQTCKLEFQRWRRCWPG